MRRFMRAQVRRCLWLRRRRICAFGDVGAQSFSNRGHVGTQELYVTTEAAQAPSLRARNQGRAGRPSSRRFMQPEAEPTFTRGFGDEAQVYPEAIVASHLTLARARTSCGCSSGAATGVPGAATLGRGDAASILTFCDEVRSKPWIPPGRGFGESSRGGRRRRAEREGQREPVMAPRREPPLLARSGDSEGIRAAGRCWVRRNRGASRVQSGVNPELLEVQ